MQSITWNDFLKVELRVGRVLSAEPLAQARKPAYVLLVDFGPEIGVRKSSAQITALYSPQALVGRLVVAVVNFPPKQIGPLMSQCLVTGFHDDNDDVALCVPDRDVPPGAIDAAMTLFAYYADMVAERRRARSDDLVSAHLCRAVLAVAERVLKPGGRLGMKIFDGAEYQDVLAETKFRFMQAKGFKPDATRDVSREMYIVARGFKGKGVDA